MRVRYTGPSVAVDLLGPDETMLRVERGHSIEVLDTFGKTLTKQEAWAVVDEKPSGKTTKGDE